MSIYIFQITANGWVYEKLGITERFTVKLHKVKCGLNISNIALSAQFFIYRVTNWVFLSGNGLRYFFNLGIPFLYVFKRFSFLVSAK
nr:hypothetical protein [uncultured bacterium]